MWPWMSHNKQTQFVRLTAKSASSPEEVKARFTVEQATNAQRGVEIQLYTFFNFGVSRGGWSTPHPGRFTPGKDLVLTAQNVG